MDNETELWELVGDKWTLPLDVRWEEGHAVVTLSKIPLLNAQREVALKELEPIRKGEAHVTTREFLETIARRSLCHTAEDVVEWRRVAAPALHFPKHDHVDEFLDSFMARGVVQSRATMSAIYSTLCAHMLQWLLEGKPLPLIFATIYPLLYRKNFCEVIHAKYRTTWRGDEDALIVPNYVAGVNDIVSTRKTKVAEWSLHVVHEPMFEAYANKLEDRIRLRVKGKPVKYWKNVRARIRRQFVYAKRVYAQFRNSTRKKSMAFLGSGRTGPRKQFRRLKHYRGDGKLYSLSHLPYWRGKRLETGRCGAVVRKGGPVPAVPSVQPAAPDVWNEGADVPK